MRNRPYNAGDYDRCCDLLRDSNMRCSFSEKNDAKLFEDTVTSKSFCGDCTPVLKDGDAICEIVMFTKCRVKKFDGLLLSTFYIDDEHLSDDNVDLPVGNAVSNIMGLGVKFVCVIDKPNVFTRFGFTRTRDYRVLCPFYIENDYSIVGCEGGFKARGELSYTKEFFE